MLLSRSTKFILSLLLTSCLLSGAVNAAPPKGPDSPYVGAQGIKSSMDALVNANTSSTGKVARKADGTYTLDTTNVQSSTHMAFGDSITAGVGATTTANSWAYLLSSDEGATLSDYAVSGAQVCDQAYAQVMLHATPAATKNPIYTFLIGTNDANVKGSGTYEAVFKTCYKAALSWLAIPATSKVYAPSCTLAGTWGNADGTWAAGVGKYTNTSGSTATCTITTEGGPLYFWYALYDTEADSSTFTYSVDGGTAQSLNTYTSPLIATQNGGNAGLAVQKITGLTAGTHTVVFTKNSSTGVFAFAGLGTPNTVAYWGSPRVFAGGVMYQLADNKSAITSAYNTDAKNVIDELSSDGLPVYFVDVRDSDFIGYSSTYMNDTLHPNDKGHSALRNKFASVEQYIAMGSSSSSSGSTFTTAVTQNVAAADSVANFMRINAGNTLSTTSLNAGLLVFGDSVNAFGMDLGYGTNFGNSYATRLFAPSSGSIAFAFDSGLPTAQSSFTNAGLIYLDTNPVMQLTSPTTGASTTPTVLSLGTNYSTTAGQYLKLVLFGTGRSNTGQYGLGVSGGSLDVVAGSGANITMFTNGNSDTNYAMRVGTASTTFNQSAITITTAATPASSTDTCTAGTIQWDTSYIYLCTAANTWKRASLSTF